MTVGPRVIWWLNPLPSLTLDWLMDDHLEDLVDLLLAANARLDSGTDKLPAAEAGWHGHHLALCVYGAMACQEMRLNRYNDPGSFWQFANIGKRLRRDEVEFAMPPWFQDEDLMRSHWSTAIREKAIVEDLVAPWKDLDEYWPVLWPVATETGYEFRINKTDKALMATDDLWLPDDVRKRVTNL